MTHPPAPIPQDQAPTGADGMIVCDRLVRIYSGKGIEVQALQGLDLLIAEGELTALIGAAGSGKSTLMNILAGLVLAALLVLAVQAVITYHRGSARALRISDEGSPGT